MVEYEMTAVMMEQNSGQQHVILYRKKNVLISLLIVKNLFSCFLVVGF